MKKLFIAIVFVFVSIGCNAQFRSLWFEASQYFQLGDSVVTVWGSDTLPNNEMVRDVVEWYLNNVKADSSIYSDTSFYSLLSLISAYADSSGYSDTSGYAFKSDSANVSDTAIYALNASTADSSRVLYTTDTVKNKTSAGLVLQSTSVIKGNSTNDIELTSANGTITLNAENDTVKFISSTDVSYIVDGLFNTSDIVTENLNAFYIELNSDSPSGAKYIDSNSFYLGNSESIFSLNYADGSYPYAFYVQKKSPYDNSYGFFKIDGYGYNISATTNLTYPISQIIGNNTYTRMSSIFDATNSAEIEVNRNRTISLINTTSDEDNSMIFEQYSLTFNYDYDGLGNDTNYFIIDTTGVTFKDISKQTTALVTDTDTAFFDKSNGSTISHVKINTTITDTLIMGADSVTSFGDAQEIIQSIEFEKLQFDTSFQAYSDGTLFYDKHESSLSYYNNIPGFKEELGRGINVKFFNNTASTLLNGTLIRSTGAKVNGAVSFTGDLAGNGSLDSLQGIAMVTVDVLPGEFGMATLIGQVNYLNTSAYVDNQLLWVGGEGTYIDTIPPPPYYANLFGRVVYADADSGAIYVFPVGETKYSPTPNVSLSFTRETETITNPGQNVSALITNATGDLYTTDYDVGFDVVSDTLRPLQAGVYSISCTYAFQGDASTADDWRIGIFVNDIEIHTVLRTSSSSNKGVVSDLKIIELESTDWVSLRIINTTNDNRDAIFTDGTINIEFISEQ